MARTTPVSKGCISLTRPVGTTFPTAAATISTFPNPAQTRATQNSATMVPPIARPIGDGGIATISSAAGKKASSTLARRSRVGGKVIMFLATAIAASAGFMESTLKPIEGRVVSTRPRQLFVRSVFDQAAVIKRENAIGEPYRRQAMGDDEDGAPAGDLRHILLDDTLAFIVERTRRLVEDHD